MKCCRFYEGGGHDGNPIHTFTDTIEKTPECPVCGLEPVQLDLSKEVTLQDLVDILATKPNLWVFPFYELTQPTSTKLTE